MTTTRTPRSRARSFALHYLQMVIAMVVGMMVLYPLWELATGDQPPSAWVHRADVDSLAMATTMVIPMAAWMRFRGHGTKPIVEMSAAMYAGFAVLFPLLWLGVIDAAGLMLLGHVLMLLFMLVAMLARPGEYTVSHTHHAHTDANTAADQELT
ncbi:hypothetical protein [Nocardioides albus]|uniref:Flagellar biosynthetic protein FliP n=1 Tax=Nocardioides albus TaxID=1841 RepID=A0A7W5F8B3_9ACTN|nr:hypothetical protein [Nocardioides albus]MBB3089050.1 hypothetical protein [Nocardioides albus]GGU14576.1 hypothetical protein GCM10007979_11370 [Nocardioides albus]